jgi:hypothetical protein
MPPPKAVIDIPIAGGLEGRAYKAVVQPGRMLQFGGVRIEKVGAVSMAPTPVVAEDLAGTNPVGLLADNGSLVKVVGDADIGAYAIRERGLPSPSSFKYPAIVTHSDTAYAHGHVYVAYTIQYTLSGSTFYEGYVFRLNVETGETTVIINGTNMHSALNAMRLCVAGDYVYACGYTAVTQIGSDGSLADITISPPPASPGMVASSICADPDPSRASLGYAYVAYLYPGTGQLRIAEVSPGHATVVYSSAATGVGSPVIRPSSTQTTKFCLCMPTVGGLEFYIWDRVSGMTAYAASTKAWKWMPAGIEYGGSWSWFCGAELGTGYLGTKRYTFTFAGALSSSASAASDFLGVVPSSHPFVHNGSLCIWMRFTEHYYTGAANLQGAEYLYRFNAYGVKTAVAKSCDNEASYSSRFHNYPDSFGVSNVSDSGEELFYSTPITPQSEPTTVALHGDSARLVGMRDAAVRSAVLRDCIVLAGGMPAEYDGVTFLESNFLVAPQIVAVTPGAGGSGSLPAGTLYAIATYEDVNARGRRTISAPTLPVSWTSAASSDVDITVTHSSIGRRPTFVYIYLSSDGINYYRAGNSNAVISAWPYVDGEVLTISSLPTTTDLLYTTGGVLENRQPGCIVDVVAHGNRFYAVQPTGKIQYSKPIVDGIGVEWSAELLEHRLLADGGGHWRLGSLDGQIVAIGERSVQIVVGDGALDTGVGSTLSVPMSLPCPGGIKPDSDAVATEEGVWYQSNGGLQLVGRSREVTGQPAASVADIMHGRTLVSAANDLVHNEVLFVLDDGTLLVRDTLSGAWIQRGSVGAGGDYAAIAANGDGDVYALDSDDEELSVVSAASPAYTGAQISIATPWLRIGSMAGDQRVYWAVLLGEWLSDMRLTMRAYFDFSETVAATLTYDFENTISTPRSVGSPFLWRQHIGRRCTAFKLAIDVAASPGSAAGACCKLFGLSLELAQRPGLLRASTTHER